MIFIEMLFTQKNSFDICKKEILISLLYFLMVQSIYTNKMYISTNFYFNMKNNVSNASPYILWYKLCTFIICIWFNFTCLSCTQPPMGRSRSYPPAPAQLAAAGAVNWSNQFPGTALPVLDRAVLLYNPSLYTRSNNILKCIKALECEPIY